jgi:metallo-beta-lactamase class B
MRKIAILAALLTLPTTSLAGQSPEWTEPLEPFRIADGLYYVGTVGLSAYLVTSSDGHILIDAPLRENVPLVLANIRKLGFDPEDIRIQLASHAHFDHVGGLAEMLDATGAELILSAADAEFVTRGADFGLGTDGYTAARPARTIGHLEAVLVGNVELTAHLTPGHTPGCTTWSGEVEIEGEQLTFVSVCSLSILGNYRIVGDQPTYAGQGADYCRSLAHLRSLSPDIFLGAHGSWFRMGEKLEALRSGNPRAFVGGGEYEAYLDGAAESIEEALAEQGHQGGCLTLIP